MGQCNSLCSNPTLDRSHQIDSQTLHIQDRKLQASTVFGSTGQISTLLNPHSPTLSLTKGISNSSIVVMADNLKDRAWVPLASAPKLHPSVQLSLKKHRSTIQRIFDTDCEYKEQFFEEKQTGIVYMGQWKNNIPHGWGTYIFPSGETYQGQIQQNIANGKGRYTYRGGRFYEGDVVKFVPDGKGRYVTDDFEFKGEWKLGKHSIGVYKIKDGPVVTITQPGYGKIVYSPTKYYEGEIKDLNPNGKGRMANNGKQYEGDWLNGLMHGKGTYTWPSGQRYTGSYSYGLKEGFGVMQFGQGGQSLIYEGNFSKGMPDGNGVFKRLGQVIQRLGRQFQSSLSQNSLSSQQSDRNQMTFTSSYNLPEKSIIA